MVIADLYPNRWYNQYPRTELVIITKIANAILSNLYEGESFQGLNANILTILTQSHSLPSKTGLLD